MEHGAFLDGFSSFSLPDAESMASRVELADQWDFLLDIHGSPGSPVMALLMALQAMGFSKDELLGICYREGVLLEPAVLHSQLSALRDGWNLQCTKR